MVFSFLEYLYLILRYLYSTFLFHANEESDVIGLEPVKQKQKQTNRTKQSSKQNKQTTFFGETPLKQKT